MKGNKKLLVIAVLLLLISVSFTTYAIYRESTTANGTVKAANWVVKVDKGLTATTPIANAEITFTGADLTCGATRYGKNNTIAPGDECTVTFTVDATGSEVDVVVEAVLDTANATVPEGITVTPSFGTTDEPDADGSIEYNSTSMTKTVTLTITWPGALSDSAAKDSADLALKGSNLILPIDITVRQNIA